MVAKKSLENLKKGKRFGPDNPPRGGGRKKSQLKDFISKESFSLDDMRKVFQGIIFTHSVEELQELIKQESTDREKPSGNKLPVPVITLIAAFLNDINHGHLNALNFIMDRLYGKPSQSVEVTSRITVVPDDPGERRTLAEQLENELKGMDDRE